MNWTEFLKKDAEMAYSSSANLVKMVDGNRLSWKPATGSNWLDTGQLLLHLSGACGTMCRGIVTGEWKDESVSPDFKPEGEATLPPASKYRGVTSLNEALQRLEADRKLAMDMIDRAGEGDLAGKRFAPPWGGPELNLGHYVLLSIEHLKMHKAQLFYYLKLQGKPVDTHALWGM